MLMEIVITFYVNILVAVFPYRKVLLTSARSKLVANRVVRLFGNVFKTIVSQRTHSANNTKQQ